MTDSEQLEKQEKLISNAVRPLIRELLLVDVSDFIAFLNFDQHHQMSDIIDSASEQFYAPGFLGYREAGTATIDWDKTPVVSLELVLNTATHTFDFTLILEKTSASVILQHIGSSTDQEGQTDPVKTLKRAIEINSLNAEETPDALSAA